MATWSPASPWTFRTRWPQRRSRFSAKRPWLYPAAGVPVPCYGAGRDGRRTQGFFAIGRLENDLLDYLLDDPCFHQHSSWGFETWFLFFSSRFDFVFCSLIPKNLQRREVPIIKLWEEVVCFEVLSEVVALQLQEISRKEPFLLKADWHTCSAPQTWGFVPRLGRCGVLHQAPLKCRAFAEALRRLVPGREARGPLGEALQQRFGAVEVQQQIWQNDWHFMRSHRDGASGLLQFGLTLEGSRYLRLGCHGSQDDLELDECNVWDDDAWSSLDGSKLVTVPLMPGDVYLATPAVLEHGVAYEPNAPTLALMFRLALPTATDEVNQCQSKEFHSLAGQVAGKLQKALVEETLRIPCLADVKKIEMEIKHGRLEWHVSGEEKSSVAPPENSQGDRAALEHLPKAHDRFLQERDKVRLSKWGWVERIVTNAFSVHVLRWVLGEDWEFSCASRIRFTCTWFDWLDFFWEALEGTALAKTCSAEKSFCQKNTCWSGHNSCETTQCDPDFDFAACSMHTVAVAEESDGSRCSLDFEGWHNTSKGGLGAATWTYGLCHSRRFQASGTRNNEKENLLEDLGSE